MLTTLEAAGMFETQSNGYLKIEPFRPAMNNPAKYGEATISRLTRDILVKGQSSAES